MWKDGARSQRPHGHNENMSALEVLFFIFVALGVSTERYLKNNGPKASLPVVKSLTRGGPPGFAGFL